MRRRSSSDAALAGAPTASHYRARPERVPCGRERIGLTFGHLLIRVSRARPYVAAKLERLPPAWGGRPFADRFQLVTDLESANRDRPRFACREFADDSRFNTLVAQAVEQAACLCGGDEKPARCL